MCVCACECCSVALLLFIHIFDCSSIRLIVRYVCHRSIGMWYLRSLYNLQASLTHINLRRTRSHIKQLAHTKKKSTKNASKRNPKSVPIELLPLSTAVACAFAIVVAVGDFFSSLYSLLVVSFYVCVCGATAIAPNLSIQ